MPATRYLRIDDETALSAPGLGAVVCYVNDTLHRHHVRLAGQGRDLRANFLPWELRGRPSICAVLRNLPPGHYLAEWPYGRLALEVLVLPNRVTQVDWRRVACFGVEPPAIAPVQPAAAGVSTAA